jgi:hypothetical protein
MPCSLAASTPTASSIPASRLLPPSRLPGSTGGHRRGQGRHVRRAAPPTQGHGRDPVRVRPAGPQRQGFSSDTTKRAQDQAGAATGAAGIHRHCVQRADRRRWCPVVPARMQAGAGGHRIETIDCALPVRGVARPRSRTPIAPRCGERARGGGDRATLALLMLRPYIIWKSRRAAVERGDGSAEWAQPQP